MKKFRKIFIEITNICNLSCDFCPKTTRSPDFMDTDLFNHILRQINGHAKYLYFHVMGEPLLHPQLGTFLDLAALNGYRVNITTNGRLIDPTREWLLSKTALRQMNLSLHSFEGNQAKSLIDVYLSRIFEFIRSASKHDRIAFALRLWNLSDDKRGDVNRYVLGRLKDEFGVDGEIENQVTPVTGLKLKENVFLHQAARFEWPGQKGMPFSETGSCYGLRDQIAILVDGTVVPCCLDAEGAIGLGNIKQDSLERILNTARAKAIAEGFSKGRVVESLCQNCDYRNRFSG